MRFCEAPVHCDYPVFSSDKITGKGYCKSHANKYRTDLDRRSIIRKAIDKQKSLNTQICSLANTDANLEGVVKHMIKGDLQEWFNFHMEISPRRCENCNVNLMHYNRLDWYGCQAHILPKSLFPSVASNLNNHMVLCKWGSCHGDFDSSWFKAQSMPCFRLAWERYLLFQNQIAQSEIRKIPSCFL